MKLKRLLPLFLAMCMIVPLLTGCTAKKIFVTEEDLYSLISYSDSELKLDTYYVKNGAKFYETYTPEGDTSTLLSQYSKDNYFWLQKDMSLIPSLYKDEIIAYSSQKETDLKDIPIKRYYDVGYSVGIYAGKFDQNGYYCITLSENVIKDSSAYNALSKASSKDIRIVEVNGKPIDPNMINDGGVFSGLSQGDSFEIGYYAGTFYETALMEADYYFLQSYETTSIDKVSSTKNGYLALTLPTDAKSGYYQIDGSGLFKYYAYERGEQVDSETDMNENYYKAGENTEYANAQQFSLNVGSKTPNVSFSIKYDTLSAKEEDISFTLVSPDKKTYEITHKEGSASIDMAVVMAGKWHIYAYPKSLEVLSIDINSAQQNADAKKETFTFTVDESAENIEFYCEYDGTGEIWGTISNSQGEAEGLESIRKNGKLYLGYTYGYLSPGTYTMTIYHFMDTAIVETGTRENTSNMEEEVIYIED